MRSKMLSLSAAVAIAGFLGACGGGGDTTNGATPPENGAATQEPGASPTNKALSNGEQAAFVSTEDVTGESDVEMELDDFYFGPTVLEGSAGQNVTLKLKNTGKSIHNLQLTGQGVDQDVAAGEEATVSLKFPDSGGVVFVCKYHTVQNMRGELTVKA